MQLVWVEVVVYDRCGILAALCCIFLFLRHKMFSVGERSGLQTVQYLDSATMKPSCCDSCSMVCDFSIVFAEIFKDLPEKGDLEVALKPLCISALMMP